MKTILVILAAGTVTVAAAALPGAIPLLLPFIRKKSENAKRHSLENALQRLREQRMLRWEVKNGNFHLAITEKGKKRLRAFEIDSMRLHVPKRWDGYWTVILFDIPESYKVARDALRSKLKQLGCLQFHKSVFVHPAPCEDEVDFITELFDIRRFVTVFQTKSLGHQEHRLYRHFAISPTM